MKTMRKIASLLLALVMIFGLATTAFADETTPTPKTYSITISNAVAGYTYEAYQIFIGELSNDATNDKTTGTTAVLSNIKWGSGVAKYDRNEVVAGTDASAIAEGLNSDNLSTFINKLDLSTTAATTSTVIDGKYTISGLAPGYYLVKNTAVPPDGTYTEYIVEVVENSTVTPKTDAPEFQKKVDDKNDSNTTEDAIVWQDSADYDIGDNVPFQLTATLPDNVASYTTYKVIIHDTLSAGLSYKGDAVVMIDGNDVTENFTIVPNGTALTFSCTNVKALDATNGSVITVEYTATLNEDAVIGSIGNPNVAYLEYSNNPNWNGNGTEPTGKTPTDMVIVFTYKVIVDKVTPTGEKDKDGKPIYTKLSGADFTLYKWAEVKAAEGETAAEYGWVAVNEATKTTTEGTRFTWERLDDGKYKLEETVTPPGYNTIDPIEFIISATHEDGDEPYLETLNGGNLFTGEVSTGALTGEVINQSGTQLPETGGMGTTLFYALGGILVVAALILLVTKKRMASN